MKHAKIMRKQLVVRSVKKSASYKTGISALFGLGVLIVIAPSSVPGLSPPM